VVSVARKRPISLNAIVRQNTKASKFSGLKVHYKENLGVQTGLKLHLKMLSQKILKNLSRKEDLVNQELVV
jgi:hypothetical protein